LAIDVDSDPEDGIDFLQDNPVNFPVLSDPAGKTPEKYGVMGMPTSYLLDATGTIVMVHEGFKRRDADMIEKRIRELAENMP
jgi:peroxiredoxin